MSINRKYRWRYRRILWFFGRVTLSIIWWDIILPRLGLRFLANRTRRERYRRASAGFRQLAIHLGGVMIKMGQFLSSRLDILPREITAELSDLQDEVEPETFADIRRVVENELGSRLEEVFSEFNPEPLAAASIGQVHLARLCQPPTYANSEDPNPWVVIKAQRPNIEEIIKVDLAALHIVAGWLNRYPPIRRRADVPALHAEFSRSLLEEVDYLNEGKNAERFAENFRQNEDVRVPHVVWSITTRRVLALEYINAIKITDYEAIDAAGIDRSRVATRLLDTYLKQMFDDRFFHADPHPGNLFVLPDPPGSPPSELGCKIIFVDFGMTGFLSETTWFGLREVLISAATRDYSRLIRAYQTLNVLLPSADLDLLERASRGVFERVWGMSIPDIIKMPNDEAMQFVREFADLFYQMPFQLPENLILFGRCVSILSGICSGLDEKFNVWFGVSPYVQKLVESESGSKVETLLKEASSLLSLVLGLPRKADALITRIEQGRLDVRTPELREQMRSLERGQRRLGRLLIFAIFLLSALQLHLAGQGGLAWPAAIAALICFFWVWLGR
jgi:predicted unusual protein kinase regulating ubiquinone biosynthesis (AarF/ABC1/UbiB family)